ncbi:MAG: hypothetical protein U0636_09310 [Phycisphaerales bacterium]
MSTASVQLLRKDARLASTVMVPALLLCAVAWVVWVELPWLSMWLRTWWGGDASQPTQADRYATMLVVTGACGVLAPLGATVAIVQGDQRRRAQMLACTAPLPDWLKAASKAVVVAVCLAVPYAAYATTAWLYVAASSAEDGALAWYLKLVGGLAFEAVCAGLAAGLAVRRPVPALCLSLLLLVLAHGTAWIPGWMALEMPGAPFGAGAMGGDQASPSAGTSLLSTAYNEGWFTSRPEYIADRAWWEVEGWSTLMAACVPLGVAVFLWRRSAARAGKASAWQVLAGAAAAGLACGALATAGVLATSHAYWAGMNSARERQQAAARVEAMSMDQLLAAVRTGRLGEHPISAADVAAQAHRGWVLPALSFGSSGLTGGMDATMASFTWARLQRDAGQPGFRERASESLSRLSLAPLEHVTVQIELEVAEARPVPGEGWGNFHLALYRAPLYELCTTTDCAVRDALVAWVACSSIAHQAEVNAPRNYQLKDWRAVVRTADDFLALLERAQAGEPVQLPSEDYYMVDPAMWPEEVHCARQVVQQVLQELGPQEDAP